MIRYSSRPPKPFRALRLIAYTLTAVSCSHGSPKSDVGLEYADRVEAALNLSDSTVEVPEGFPSRRDRRHDLDAVRVSFGAWNDLESCAAGGLIAEANSPLGRVRGSFERFQHSHALAAALNGCEQTMTASAWEKFQKARDQKAEQLDEERWNAFWMSEPVERSFGRTTPLEKALVSEGPLRWRELASSLQPAAGADVSSESWYDAESLLNRTPSVGQALRFMQLTTQALERVAQAVETSREGRVNCSEQDQAVMALMREHYSNRLQPLMASGDDTLRTASEVLAELVHDLTPSEGVPVSMQAWVEQWREQAAFQRYRTATRNHAEAMGKILSACNATL